MSIYIKFENVDGPCKRKGLETWIEMESWSWSCAREQSKGNQIGHAAGVAKFEALEFSAPIGSATMTMWSMMMKGVHFGTVVIHAVKSADSSKKPEPWMIVELKHVMVTSISQEISEDDDSDTIAVVFGEVKMKVCDQDEKGTLNGGIEFEHNCITGETPT